MVMFMSNISNSEICKKMSYKEFFNWCNERAFDGCWGAKEAIFCLEVVRRISSVPFWKRKELWQKLNEEYSIENSIVIPINNKIKEIYGVEY